MTLSRRIIDELLQSVRQTRAVEANCDECLRDLAEFAEHQLAAKSITHGLEAVQHHLLICAECREEYETLLQALKALDA